MYATDHFEHMVLNTFRGQNAQAPTQLYIGLYLSNPGEGGAAGVEASYSGYARQEIAFSAPAPLNGGIGVVNLSGITFPISPVSPGTVTHIGVLDSQTGGNMLLYGAFTESMQVEANEAPVIVAGEAQWWITGGMSTAYKTKTLNLLRGQSITGFSPHLALYNGDPESGGAELSGGGYGRMAVTFSAPEEQTGGQTRITNSAALSSDRSTDNWGTWSYTVVFDEADGGLPAYALQRAAKEMGKGKRVLVDAGNLSLFLN